MKFVIRKCRNERVLQRVDFRPLLHLQLNPFHCIVTREYSLSHRDSRNLLNFQFYDVKHPADPEPDLNTQEHWNRCFVTCIQIVAIYGEIHIPCSWCELSRFQNWQRLPDEELIKLYYLIIYLLVSQLQMGPKTYYLYTHGILQSGSFTICRHQFGLGVFCGWFCKQSTVA